MQVVAAHLEPSKCDFCGGDHDNGCCEIDFVIEEDTCDMRWSSHIDCPCE